MLERLQGANLELPRPPPPPPPHKDKEGGICERAMAAYSANELPAETRFVVYASTSFL